MALPVFPQAPFLDDTGRPSRIWQAYFTMTQNEILAAQTQLTALQNQVNALFNNTLPGSPLPMQPDGYVVLMIGGRSVRVPFYNN